MFFELVAVMSACYIAVGLCLYTCCRHSIVFENRKPYLVLFEIVAVTITLYLDILVLKQSLLIHIPNYLYVGVIGITSIISSMTAMTRVSYVYLFLVNKTNLDSKVSLYQFSRLFWNDNRSLKVKKFVLTMILLSLLSTVNTIIYYSVKGFEEKNYNAQDAVRISQLVNVFASTMLLIYAFKITKLRIFDRIGMSLELVLYSVTIAIIIVVCLIVFQEINVWFVLLQCWSSIFYGLYFPMIFYIKHKRNLGEKINSTATLMDSRLFQLCKDFYCEENAFFLQQYELYLQGSTKFENITRCFIDNGATYELNIYYKLKQSVLNAKDEDAQSAALRKVYSEVVKMIQENITPYKDNVH